MLVRDIMRRPAIAVPSDTTLEEAYGTMQREGIRHLPIEDGGRLVGVVTDRDLRLATSTLSGAPRPPGRPVSEVMTRNPQTADPEDAVEDAARRMRQKKIGCLPVLEGGRLAGIITGLDLLDAILRMTGVDKPSGRIEVRLADQPGELARLTGFFGNRGLNVHSILTHPESAASVRAVLRVGSIETRPLAEELRGSGFDVVWPPEKPWPR
jgi:acetoin utilization protein AcuB